MDDLKATVIIPTYNKPHRLSLVLEGFQKQNIDFSKFEVIIVNDGSDKEIDFHKLIEPYNFTCTLLNQSHSGRSQARNRGLEHANYPIIIFCDDDTIASHNFIHHHLLEHQKNEQSIVHGLIYDLPFLKFFRNPLKGTVYPEFSTSHTNAESLKQFLISKEDIKDFTSITRQARLSYFEKIIQKIQEDQISDLYWLSFTGGNVSVKKKDILAIGDFDPTFGTQWGCEDIELGYRFFLKDFTFIYSKAAVNYHITHYRCDYKTELNKSIAKFSKKYPSNHLIPCLPNLLTGNIRSIHDFMSFVQEHYRGVYRL